MNSTMRSVFNKSFVEKNEICKFREQCTGPTEKLPQPENALKRKTQMQTRDNQYPNGYLIII